MTNQREENDVRDTWMGVVLVVVIPVALLVIGAWTLPDIHAAADTSTSAQVETSSTSRPTSVR
jgi:hypothetical protein